jgi:L-lactate dehydrogenase complex protein LldE
MTNALGQPPARPAPYPVSCDRMRVQSMAQRRRVQLLVTCLVDRLFPDTGMAIVDVLERLGVTVSCPDGQTCCGQPAFNSGATDDAVAMAKHTIDVLSQSSDPVVVPSGSCGDMIIHQYEALLAGDPVYGPKAHAVKERTFEFTQYLVDELGVTDVGAIAGDPLTYHACCHGLRGLGVDRQPLALLDAIEGGERRPLPEHDVCCGFGGLFAVKMPAISSAMLDRKLDAIEGTQAKTVVVTDVSCGMHMAGGLHRRGSSVRVCHIADVLAERTPREPRS